MPSGPPSPSCCASTRTKRRLAAQFAACEDVRSTARPVVLVPIARSNCDTPPSDPFPIRIRSKGNTRPIERETNPVEPERRRTRRISDGARCERFVGGTLRERHRRVGLKFEGGGKGSSMDQSNVNCTVGGWYQHVIHRSKWASDQQQGCKAPMSTARFSYLQVGELGKCRDRSLLRAHIHGTHVVVAETHLTGPFERFVGRRRDRHGNTKLISQGYC